MSGAGLGRCTVQILQNGVESGDCFNTFSATMLDDFTLCPSDRVDNGLQARQDRPEELVIAQRPLQLLSIRDVPREMPALPPSRAVFFQKQSLLLHPGHELPLGRARRRAPLLGRS